MDDKAIHAVKKELEAFLIKALYDRKMFKREAPYTQRAFTAVDATTGSASMRLGEEHWWDAMYTDIRDYFLPLQVLQEYVAAGQKLGDPFE